MTEIQSTGTTHDDTTDPDQVSRMKRYDKRVEEWLGSLKDEAEQRSPEVLSALAAKAKDVGDYLDKMAEKARSRSEPADSARDASGDVQATSEESRSSTNSGA